MQRTTILRELQNVGGAGFVAAIPALAALGELVDLRFEAETWDDDAGTVTITGNARTRAAGFKWQGLSLRLGAVAGRRMTLPFTIIVPARPIEAITFAASIEAGVTVTTEAEILLPDSGSLADALQQFADDLAGISITIGPIPVHMSLETDWLRPGRVVRDAQDRAVGVEADPDRRRIAVPLDKVSLTANRDGVSFDLTAPASLSLPPLMLAGTGLALELRGLTFKLGEGPLPAGMAAFDPALGFDETWRGLFAGTIRLWNLDKVFPGGPEGAADAGPDTVVEADGLAIDANGLTGSLVWRRPADGDALLALERVEIGFERGYYPRKARAEGRLDLSASGAGILPFKAALEVDPFSESPWRLDLQVTRTDFDAPLLAASGSAALTTSIAAASAALGDGDIAVLMSALAAGENSGVLSVRTIELTSLGLSATLAPSGFAISARMSGRADIVIDALDEPVPLVIGMGDVVVGHDPDQGFSANWNLTDGLDLVLPLSVDVGGVATLDRIALFRRNNGHLAIEIGMTNDGSGDVAIGGLPNVVTLVYDPVADRFLSPELRREGQDLTLLVPGTLYAKGSLRRAGIGFPQLGPLPWGEPLSANLTVYLVGTGTASAPEDHLQKEHYLYALDLGLLTATRADGLRAMVLTGHLSFKPGLPLGATGAALYGIGLTYAQNAEPDAQDGDYTDWFLRQAPEFSTTASKWRPRGERWGFGAGVTLGSLPDDGRSWNIAAGLFLLLPGPVVMITGKGSLFKPPPSLPVGGEGRSVDAPFAAAVVLDLLRNRFAAELTADFEISAGDFELLSLSIPAKIEASLAPPIDMELSIGRFMPEEARVAGRALGLYDITTYVMISTRGIPDFPEPGRRLPPFAMAYGGSGGLRAGFSSAIAELMLKVEAGFDLGVSLAVPPLMIGRVFADGSLVARIAFIGLNIGLRTDLLVVAPDPFELSGRVRLRIGLPWPLPDIRFSGSFRIGAESTWPSDYPAPDDPIADVSLFTRPNGTSVLDTGDSFDGMVLDGDSSVAGVPVDAGILAAFRAPVGNADPVIGRVKTQADDTADPVWEVASTGETEDGRQLRIGWRHVLSGVELRAGGQGVDVLAGWSMQAASGTREGAANIAAGGQADRRALYLMSPLDAPVEARYGTGATVLADVISGWSPCEENPDPKEMLQSFAVPGPDDLGIVRPLPRTPLWLPPERWHSLERHGKGDAAHVRIHYIPAVTGSMALPSYRTIPPLVLGMTANVSFRLQPPLDRPDRVLSLPTAIFATQRDLDRARAARAQMHPPAGRLELRVPDGVQRAEVHFLLRNGTDLDVRDGTNAQMNQRTVFAGTISRGSGEFWQLVTVAPDAGSVMTVSAAMLPEHGGSLFGSTGAVLIGATLMPPVEERREALARRGSASAKLVAELGAQAAGWTTGHVAGLLQPGTSYELTLQVDSFHARQVNGGSLEVAGAAIPFRKTVRFRTEEDIAQPLAPRRPAARWAPDRALPWNVDTGPRDTGYLYRSEEVAVRFADAITAGRIAAHGRAMVLSLTHESGRTVEEAATNALAQAKRDLSKLQDIVSDYVSAQACLAPSEPLWLSPSYRFSTLLEPGRYKATLLGKDSAGARPPVPLHEWGFSASRWMTQADHLDAHDVAVKLRPGSGGSLAAQAAGRIGANDGGANDAALEAVLHDILGLAPALPAPDPVLIVGLHADGCVWVLFDGPETLLRAGSTLRIEQNGASLPISATIANAARTRALVCLARPATQGALTLRLGNRAVRLIDIPVFADMVAV